MSGRRSANENPVEPSGAGSPTWWLVCRKELREIWVGGRALNLIVAYTILLGVYTYYTARSSTVSFIPPKEMVYELLKLVMVVSVFMGLIIGADNLSGERERATLEALLLTPASRRQIVVGKFFAAVSPWPVALAIAVPYMKVLSQGDEVFGQAVVWGAIMGSILTPAFTALGMFVSFWCATNKSSLFVSLAIYLLFLLPTQLSGHAQGGFMGLLFQGLNPMASPRVFLAGLLVNNRTLDELRIWLLSPALFALIVFALLFWYAGPGLRLETGRAHGFRLAHGRAMGVALIAYLAAFIGISPLVAQPAAPQAEQPAVQSPDRPPLQISIDMDAKTVKAGTTLLYNTVVTNHGTTASAPLIVAMNIINLKGKGDPVDPEDWSPERTQYHDGLAPGESATLSWRVNAILDGDFMVYMVAIPSPAGVEATSQPEASSGIHVTVTPFTKLNPGGVLPYAIGGPVLLALVILFVYRRRRREIDAGGAR
jgi:ABC-2 type transport system permease protein